MARTFAVPGCLVGAASVLLATFTSRGLAAQPEAAESIGAPRSDLPQSADPPSLLSLDELSLDLGLEWSYDRRETRSEVAAPLRLGNRQSNRVRRFEETVGLRGSGWIADERWMLFDVASRWGLSQERFLETRGGVDSRQSSHGDLLEYEFNLALLPHGTLSATVSAQRLDSRIPRAFQPSLDRTRERYGVDVLFSSVHLPMRLSFEHVWDELTGRTGILLDDERRGRDTFQYEVTWQISERHSLRMNYEYDDRRERYSGSDTSFDTTRDYIIVNHVLRFGEEGRSSWETLARFQDETGDLARDNTEVSTRLRLQHTEGLTTNYGAQFLRDSFQGQSTRTWRGEAGLTHELGELLTTSVHLYGLRRDTDEAADLCEWGGSANVAVNRQNRLGRFSANLSYNHVATDTGKGDGRGVVIAESITFRDPLPTYLVHRDIDLFTLVVTDVDTSRILLPGRDYIAVRVGRHTGLRRVPTGRIADRQTALVSYTYQVFSDYRVTRDRIDLRVQQAFDSGLTSYYAASFQNEDIDDSRFLPYRTRDVNRHRIGTTYRSTRWSLGLECEYHDDAIDPYQAVHLNGDSVWVQGARHQLDGRGTLSWYWFDGSNGLAERDTLLIDVGASYRYRPARNLETDVSALYRYEDDSLFGITHSVDLTATLDWRIGDLSVLLETEYDLLDLPDSRDDGVSFWVKLRRDIPVWVAKAQ